MLRLVLIRVGDLRRAYFVPGVCSRHQDLELGTLAAKFEGDGYRALGELLRHSNVSPAEWGLTAKWEEDTGKLRWVCAKHAAEPRYHQDNARLPSQLKVACTRRISSASGGQAQVRCEAK